VLWSRGYTYCNYIKRVLWKIQIQILHKLNQEI
jgi:hypothetical protein